MPNDLILELEIEIDIVKHSNRTITPKPLGRKACRGKLMQASDQERYHRSVRFLIKKRGMMNFVNIFEIKKQILDYKCKRINFQIDPKETRTPDNSKPKTRRWAF